MIDPELEVWVWSDSPHIPEILGWPKGPALRDWLELEGLWSRDRLKLEDPEIAFRRAVRQAQLPPSSALFRGVAEKVGLQRCVDPSFLRLLEILRGWFAAA